MVWFRVWGLGFRVSGRSCGFLWRALDELKGLEDLRGSLGLVRGYLGIQGLYKVHIGDI